MENMGIHEYMESMNVKTWMRKKEGFHTHGQKNNSTDRPWFFSYVTKKKKKSSDRPIIFCTGAVFLFVFVFVFFLKTWGTWTTWAYMNIWKAWMLKLEWGKKKAFTHTRTKKQLNRSTLIFFLRYKKKKIFRPTHYFLHRCCFFVCFCFCFFS